jgi:histidyl-tRNA synthetase
MRQANASGARYAVILGPDELAAGEAQLKPLQGGEPRMVPLWRIADALTADT